jgi:lipoprotein signal peptidase
VSRLWSSVDGVYTNSKGESFTSTSGLVPVFVMITSALIMAVCGILLKKFKIKWINDYALPLSMVIGMAAAIPLTALFGGAL